MPLAIHPGAAAVITALAGHAGPALRKRGAVFSVGALHEAPVARWRQIVCRGGRLCPPQPGCGIAKRGGQSRPPLRRVIAALFHSSGPFDKRYRASGRRAPVTAREVRAAAGTSALGAGVGPYGVCRHRFPSPALHHSAAAGADITHYGKILQKVFSFSLFWL